MIYKNLLTDIKIYQYSKLHTIKTYVPQWKCDNVKETMLYIYLKMCISFFKTMVMLIFDWIFQGTLFHNKLLNTENSLRFSISMKVPGLFIFLEWIKT